MRVIQLRMAEWGP